MNKVAVLYVFWGFIFACWRQHSTLDDHCVLIFLCGQYVSYCTVKLYTSRFDSVDTVVLYILIIFWVIKHCTITYYILLARFHHYNRRVSGLHWATRGLSNCWQYLDKSDVYRTVMIKSVLENVTLKIKIGNNNHCIIIISFLFLMMIYPIHDDRKWIFVKSNNWRRI